MKSSQIPPTQTQTVPKESVCVEPSMPGVSGGPPKAVEASANTTTQDKSRRLIIDSPFVLVSHNGGGFTAKPTQSTPDDPADLILYRSLLSAGNLTEAARLCRERLLVSGGDEHQRVRWVKDLAIVKRREGLYQEAYDLHLTIHSAASRFGGAFRGRIEHSFARSFETLGMRDDALDHYTAGRFFAEVAGDLILCAQIDTNTGRCLVSSLKPECSHGYFERALKVAEAEGDSLLQGEILESESLAFEAQGELELAFHAAAQSVSVLAGTTHEAALTESLETRGRLRLKLVSS